MNKFARKAGRFMLYLLGVVLVLILILAAWLLIISPGKPKPFLGADGKPLEGSISEKIRVNINGVEQGMFIRGRDKTKPVLLFLHGGPGMPEYFLAEKYSQSLEEEFVVCYWEQRGAGLSYRNSLSPESITVEQLISDTIEVTNYLRERFGQDKIYLMAHSWGSFLGIQTAAKAPELYHAYIGVAQISQMMQSERIAYKYMMEQYTLNGDTAIIKKLADYAVLDSDEALRLFFVTGLRDEAMHRLGIGTTRDMKSVITGVFLPSFQSRAYTLGEKITIWKAKAFLRTKTGLLDELFTTDSSVKTPKLEIPAYFMSGKYDYTVNYDMSKAYLDKLEAPVKGFYTFDNSAHSPMFEEAQKFMQIMLEDVLNSKTELADK